MPLAAHPDLASRFEPALGIWDQLRKALALPSEPADIDGCNTTATGIGMIVKETIVETLTTLDPDDSTIEPRLATAWEYLGNGTWRISLREGVFGDILCARMVERKAVGLVTDGVFRDLQGVLGTGLSVWCLGAAAAPSVAGLTFVGWEETVGCGGVCVIPGDSIVADHDGAEVIPCAYLAQVLDEAPEQERREGWIADEVGRGAKLPGLAFPLMIVVIAANNGPWPALVLAASEPEAHARIMHDAHLSIAAFGGTFLMMVGPSFFFDNEKDVHWVRFVEARMARYATLRGIEISLGAMYVRLMTIMLVEKGTLTQHPSYLEHGAFYAIIALSMITFAQRPRRVQALPLRSHAMECKRRGPDEAIARCVLGKLASQSASP